MESNTRNQKLKKDILFICKKRKLYGQETSNLHSSGLFNSVKFIAEMLNANHINTEVVEVIDNNDIDREVTRVNPKVVIIEALWVVPEKFDILKKLHPNVKWIVRLHSEIPFLANEGIAMEWISKYIYNDIYVASNSRNLFNTLKPLSDKILYLPNYYPVKKNGTVVNNYVDGVIDIGCFGAIRPLKNHLIQAVSAIKFADIIGKKLYFHINATRVEQSGESILKNLRNLFKHSRHELVEHKWYEHNVFLCHLSWMDISMQCSFSETFNIVTADAVNLNVPVVVSKEIKWVNWLSKTSTTSVFWQTVSLLFVYYTRGLGLQKLNKINLKLFSRKSKKLWKEKMNELVYWD